MPESTDIYTRNGIVREQMYCHSCRKNFLAIINYDLNGNHEIQCPHCHHIHYRKIQNGKVTEERYGTDPTSGVSTDPAPMWKSTTQPITTHHSAGSLIRDLWLNRSDSDWL